MRLGFGEKLYEFDADILTVEEARFIKKNANMGLNEFGEGMRRGDPDVMVAMVAIAMMRAGEQVTWSQFNKLNIAALQVEEDESDRAKVAGAEAAAGGDDGEGGGDAEGGDVEALPTALHAVDSGRAAEASLT